MKSKITVAPWNYAGNNGVDPRYLDFFVRAFWKIKNVSVKNWELEMAFSSILPYVHLKFYSKREIRCNKLQSPALDEVK